MFKLFSTFLFFAHAGHTHVPVDNVEHWLQWIGHFHRAAVHFPIALGMMTLVAEMLYRRSGQIFYEHAANLMLGATAAWSLPTALLGLTLGASTTYEGIWAILYTWHALIGFINPIIATYALYFRKLNRASLYITSLCLLFVLLIVSGFTGSGLVFGLSHWMPPLPF